MEKESRKKGRRFGQRAPPLTELIKSILERYPDGGQILKELIQNADDAGATEVEFLYDNRYFGTESLESPELAKFQGPALYCHNNAIFKDEDWEGIQSLMRSSKKDDPLKVGRFGIGFNSVYHITDLPGIVSGNTVGFLDPHETYFERGESGQRYDINDNLLDPSSRDQFIPFDGIFGCNLADEKTYDGTLFRFPLRTTPSDLSEKKYTKEKINNLFESLRQEASVILLFLKSVQKISVHERQEDGNIACVFKVQAAEGIRAQTEEIRKKFLREATGPNVTTCSYIIDIQADFGSNTRNFRWLVVNQAGSNDKRITELADELKLLPWVGLAAPIDVQTRNDSAAGRIFCFLPLPPDVDCQTGLPVHVHGYFALTDNRRGLVWPGPECQNTLTGEWNELLLKNIAVEVYTKLLDALVTDHPSTGIDQEQRSQLVYYSLPSVDNVRGHWEDLSRILFTQLARDDHKLFFAQHLSGNSWITLNQGILDQLQNSQVEPGIRDVILRILFNSSQVTITDLPPHVHEIVARYFSPRKTITPSLLRSVLKTQDIATTSRQDKLLLLEYVLSDDPSTDLSGVPLLPLASGQFIEFCAYNGAPDSPKSVFVSTTTCARKLLPNMEHRFLDENLSATVSKKLSAMTAEDASRENPTQLVWLNKESVVRNLRSSLPSEWFDGQEKVEWTVGYPNHPPESWLNDIWNWIRSSFPESFSQFESIPLIEISTPNNKYLGILSQDSKFIFASDSSGNTLPPVVTSLLSACSCIVIPDKPLLRHPDINRYIAPPTPVGTLTVLSRTSLQTAKSLIKETTAENRIVLRSFFCTLPEGLTTAEKSFLLQLPLFDTLSGYGTAVQVDDRILKAASPDFSLPDGFELVKSDQIISSADHTSRQLLALLSVEILKPAEVFLQFLFPDIKAGSVYDPEKTSAIMVWIVQQMFNFKSQCERFPEQVMALPFVRTDHEQLRKPSELYDPSDDILRDLFLEEEAKFPTEDFRDPKLVSELKALGLQTRNMVTAVELLEVAMKIDSCPLSQSSMAKVRALIKILQDKPAYLQHKVDGNATLKQKLHQLKWLPCSKDRPVNSRFPKIMPWFNGGSSFFSPAEIRSESHVLLIGSVMPILHVEMNKTLQEEFGLTSDPPLHNVVNQLKKAVRCWEEQLQRKGTSEFQEMLLAIYLQLSKIPKESVSVAISDVSLEKWIWQGDGFCSPTQTALQKDFPLDLRPHLFLLPDSLRDPPSLPEFFLRHGVRQLFSEQDILGVLVDIRNKHTKNVPTLKEVKNDLTLCVSILEWAVKDEKTLDKCLQERVLIPVQSNRDVLVLQPCKECTYCDRDWLRRGESELEIPENFLLVHDFVPMNVAKLLGVPPLSTCLVSAETLGFDHGFDVEQTGPYEPITTRLKNILNEYKEGVGLFKELIQNADDAGARTVRFLVDWRHGPKEKLLSPKMAECQGPALWAYNDAVFTDKDFENINKLAGATKVEDLAKIGRFGLGFNAVYHLTDVPSFVSREYLVIFDPNVNHLDNHIKDKSRPGIRINLATNPRPLTAFEDQFQPYHDIFGCDTQCRDGKKFHCDGTLFRFPFRTLQQASKSEICDSIYNREKVEEIVTSLKESASLLLLYAQHVKKIELYQIGNENNPKEMKLVLSVEKNPSQQVLPGASLHTVPFIEQCSEWWRKRLASEDCATTNPSRSELITIDVKEVVPDGLGNLKQLAKHETWLLSSSVGTGSSAHLALGDGRSRGLLPCAGAAAKLLPACQDEATDTTTMLPAAVEGEAFCFLPLSIATGLPVHVNGYFAITSNRRGIWERNTSEHCTPIEVQWNEALMEDALTNAYLQLFEDIKRLCPDGSLHHDSYYKLWPCYDSLKSGTWGRLVTSVYSKIMVGASPLLLSNRKWLDINSGHILDKKSRKIPGVIEAMNCLRENVFQLTTEVHSSMSNSGHAETLRRRTLTMKQFFEKFFFPNIAKIPQDLRDPIIWFGLGCISREEDNELIPLFAMNAFVSTDQGLMKKPSELYDPNDAILLDLFSERENKFPSRNFVERNMISTLKKLGLRSKTMLTSDELLEVALQITSFSTSHSSTLQVQALIKILQDNVAFLNQCVDGNTTLKDKLLHLKWLPRASIPPENCRYPEFMPWYNSSAPFFAPNELQTQSRILVVGSSMPILGVEINEDLQNQFGLSGNPPTEFVVSQLQTACKSWEQQKHSGDDFKFQEMLMAIYLHLSQLPNENVVTALNIASLKRWVWQGNGFCSTAQVALEKDFAMDLRPHLFALPENFKIRPSLAEFFTHQGVQQKFSEQDILGVLPAIKDKHTSLPSDLNVSNEVKKDLKLCRSILEWVVKDDKTLPESLQEKVLVPVESGRGELVLQPRNKCTYCDQDWFRRGKSELDIPEDYLLVHDSVPIHLAELLGVPPLSTCLVSAETLGFDVEQTGPYEPITTRLKNILNEYKEGVGVFKELIQNADDAGASTVRFLVDWRHGPKEKLLSPKMAECQGPALWAYNDAVFTDKDFENINKLAGATKVEDLAKIGRFGLGFNAVYHLTDVPSFVSREYLVIFDPNVNHLDNHIKDKSRPGIRINLATNPRPLTAFEDQFQPYHDIFGCSTQCRDGKKFHCDGTLFRFPFRTIRQASESEICGSIYTRERVEEIVASLKESASLLLLYTQHIKKIELYQLGNEDNPKEMKQVLSVEKNPSQQVLPGASPHTVPFIEQCSEWWRKRLASEDCATANPSRSELITIEVKEVVPDGLGNLKQLAKHETWLLSSSVGTGSSAHLALGDGRSDGLLPCAGAAAKLLPACQDEATDTTPVLPAAVEGEAFCFLPLSIATGLPVHVNGYFAITSNRRGIWERSTSEHCTPIEVQWNEALMEDALTNAYLQLFEDIKRLCPDGSLHHDSYYKLWPCYDSLQSATWGRLVTSVYSKIVVGALPLLLSNGKWLGINSGHILDKKLRKIPEVLEAMNCLRENVFQLTSEVHSSMSNSGHAETLRRRTLTMKQFFEKFFFPNIAKIPQDLRDPIIWFGLGCISRGEEDELIPLFAINAFVSSDQGLMKKPSKLYDPNDAILLNLFSERENKFPSRNFVEKDMISTLKKLGLRSKTMLTSDELLEVALQITSSSASHSSTVQIKALIKILQDNVAFLNQFVDGNTTLKDKLLHLKWLPRASIPPENCRYPEFMPWYNGSAPFFAPDELQTQSRILVVGSSMPILGVEMNEDLQNQFGLSENPPTEFVVSQLQTACKSWEQQNHSGDDFKFQEMLMAIYLHLSQLPNDNVVTALNIASLKRWVWQGNGFCSPAQVALERDFAMDLRPHLFALPENFKIRPLAEFFTHQGVRQKFSQQDILGVLAAIKDKHASLPSDLNVSNEVKKDLKLCRSILEWVVKDDKTLPESLQEKVLVPVESGSGELVLQPRNKCTYCDQDWFRRGKSELDIPEGYLLVHDSVPIRLAKQLDVPPLSTCLVSAETLGYQFEQTGPYEPLTTRLKNILNEYKEGASIFKELIQNADDAGARSVCFLVDWRHGPKEKLLSPKMAECQGPALWAYNDAVFTDKDFENINKLAGATKVEDLAKIGRFGLGFNAVYHLTDVPSFVSREYLVIFDPNVNHLDNYIKDKSRPGIRINLARNPRPLTAFEDQFQPYHDIFGCNTQCRDGEKFNYDGTIFRFPFRTGREANESEISQTVYDSEKVENIVKSLNETASLLLLFTQHVNNVTLYELGKDENPKMTRKILSVKKNEAQDTLSAGISNAIPFMEQCSDWWKKRLTPNCDIKAGPSRSDLVTIDIEVFNGTEYSQKRETWLRSSSVGTGLSVGLAMGYGPVHGLLPCAGAVGKLSITPENEAVDSNRMISESVKGEAFCFLPLSIPTGFPVHINGCFAITSNRRGIWERSAGVECQPIEVQWNESLMEDALTSAYLQLLEEMKRLSEEKKLHNYSYYKLWPSYDTLQSSTWKTLVKSFYKKMVEEDLPLFQSNGNWLDIHSGYILGEILSEAPAIVETLNSLEESVFLLTPELCSSISKAGQDEVLQSRTLNLVKFFENFFFPKITSIPQNLRDPLVAFGLDCISKEQNDVVPLFRENACIPCSEDGSQLAKPCNLISPEGEAACLYSEEDGRLPVGEDFLERKRLHVLEELGMVKDQLPWSEICERAKSVKKLAAVSYEGALERARNLINYLNRDIAKRPDEESDHQTILQSTNFLPFITIPPPEYGLPWKGCDEHGQALFRSPKDLFMATDVDLVGSCFLIVDESRDKGCGHMNAEVKQLLGFPERRPNNSQVLQQLNAIINTWSEMSENDRKAKKSVVERTCKSIYKYFNDFLVSAVAEQEGVQNEAVEYIKTELASIPWLFIQGSFVSTEKVARKWIGNGAPFLYGLPDGFADNYENLMLLVEVKGSFDASDFVTALHQLRVSKENAALDDNELKIAICFLQELKDVQQDLLEKSSNRLFLPDNNKVLRLASELTISNTPWLLQVASSAQYVHKDITNDLAFKFGAKWLKDRILDPYSKSIVTPFGQHEKLTDRLKTILKDYPCDAGILKELVQNADDAQATEIHFIYDTRNLPCERVFQEHAEEVQGPALCVYNNRPFSDKDLEGIQKIGIGSKNEDPEKTGQFGIGFNAVYHLTDCPSFLSNNETLCVFDPHCRYARGATPEYPGRQFGPIDDKFREGFSHSLSGYNINEQLNLKGSTMFRLPLRTVQRSRHSLISKKFFSEDKMRDLISKFKSEAKKMLLFLNHMKKISISEIDKNGKLRQQYVVSSIMDAEDEEKRRNMTALAKKCKDTPTDKIPWQGVTYPMILSDSNGITEEWLVHQCFGVKRNGPEVEIPDGKKYGLLPRGGVAALVSRLPKRERGWIPNEPRHVAYCFLPLPVFTPLPVHVNGHFALNSSRRALWVDTDSIGPLTKWNNFVKSCVLAPGYAALILEARKYMPHSEREPTDKAQCYFPSDITADLGLGWYHKLFPNISESTDEWKTLADHVYGFLGKTEAPVLPVVVADEPNGDEDGKKLPRRIRKWISAQEGLFVERLLPNESLWKVLLQIHLPMLVKSPSRICSAFTEAGVPSRFLSPQSVIDDLRTFRSNGSVCQLGDVPSKLEDTTIRSIAALKELISYCSKVEKRFTGLLNGLPLLLTADGQLRVFEVGHPVYCSKFSDLFPKRNDSFVHPELVRDLRSIMINDKTKTATNDTNTNEQDQPVPRVLQDLTVNAIAQFMSDVFPSTARATSNHLPFPDDDLPTKEWLMRLWVFLQNHAELEQPETKVPLQALGKWPIIPTMCGKLVTVDNAKTVFDLTASERESSRQEKVRECLKKLKCPSLDKEITFEKLNKRTSSIRPSHRKKPVTDPHVSHPHSAADILRVFKYMNEAKLLDVSELCEEDVREILLYFQDDYENLKPKEHFNKILKDLPMYKAMNNNHYSLSSFSSYVVVPVGVPVSGIHVLQRSTNCLFLHYDAALSLKKLYQELGAGTERSVPQFYIEYILPNFHLLSPESQKEYLLHLRDDILHSSYAVQDEKDLVDVLKNTCCIPTREGQLRRARDLYDPRNTVFKVMLDEDDSRFPSSPFNGSEWLEFLEVIGLKTEVEATEFLIFCNRVASLANQSPESEVNIKRSKELVKYLLTKDHLREPRFLASLSTVKFIASERVGSVLLSLHKQCHCRDQNQQPPFLQFSNSVPWRYKKLVWSSAPLLPEWVQPTTDLDLGIQNPPSVDSVVSHLQNISTSLAEHSKKEEALPQPQVVKKIMTGIYEFLRKKIQCCGKEISQNCCPDCESIGYRLRTTACILVEDEKVLVRGDQLSFNDPKKSLQPFLYVVPREYGNYEHLLKRLGATEKFTSLQLACVFKEIKNRCKDVHMNPDLEKKARNAMHLFFKCIMEESSGGNGKSTTSKLTELYLPSEDKHMVKSNIMVYRVPARHAPTVTKLEYHVLLSLEKCELPRAQENEYIQSLAEHLRPTPFDKVVKERLDPLCLKNDCQLCKDNTLCDFIEKHISIMKSRGFHEGLVRLMKHQKNDSHLTEEEKEKLSRLASIKVEIKCMVSIKIHLILAGTHQPLENSSAPRQSYVVKNEESWTLYIQHQTGMKSRQSYLSKSVNKILEWLLNNESLLVVADMLSCESPSQITAVLDDHDIPRDVSEDGLMLGREVPFVFHYLMQQNPLFIFHRGELVAFEVKVPDRNDGENEALEDLPEEDEFVSVKYVLAEVIDCVSPQRAGEAYDFEARYLIDLGKEKKEVSVLDLYKFLQNDPDEVLTREMVLFAGDASVRPTNMDDAKREIREALRAAWRLPPDMRRKVIKRLYLRWHPDKNPNNREFATEMMAFLLSEIKRMKEEERRIVESPVDHDFDDLFRTCDNRAQRERETYRNYRTVFGGSPGGREFSSECDYTVPRVSEARRWLEQSRRDLEAADFLLSACKPFDALACFLSHQIVEKSLKAALYAKCGLTNDQLHTHDVYALACKVGGLTGAPPSVTELAAKVSGYYLTTRYPNRQPHSIVPADAFSNDQSKNAVESARKLFQLIKGFTGITRI